MRRLLVAAAAGLVAVMGFGLTTASAATLDVTTAPATFFMQESACAPATSNGTPVIDAAVGGTATANSYNQVSLSDIPEPCRTLPLEVFVHGLQGELVASTSAPIRATSSAVTVNVGDFTGSEVTYVVLRIDGWLFPTSWTAPEVPSAPFVDNCVMTYPSLGLTEPCTVTVNVGPVEMSEFGEYQTVRVTVSHSHATQLYWTADFNFAELPGLQVEPTKLGSEWNNAYAPQGCADFPIVSLRGAEYQYSMGWYIGQPPGWVHKICN